MAEERKPLRVLFQAWYEIPHSYAIVNCFQLIHLYKNFGLNGKISKNRIDIYIEEMPYYNSKWYYNKRWIYPQEYNDILQNMKKYNGEQVDIIYRQTYPYNITLTSKDIDIPKCVFYTSENKNSLTPEYFELNHDIKNNDAGIRFFLEQYRDTFYFTSPSKWSSFGMKKYLHDNDDPRNRIITHGVDMSLFYKITDNSVRERTRKIYNIENHDVLLLSVGAMTTNKGTMAMLELLHILVNKMNKPYFKLLLKGLDDLYDSAIFVNNCFHQLVGKGIIKPDEVYTLCNNHIIYVNKTLDYVELNELYNASDLYLAPYLAEGFSLIPLEALASGLSVLVPETGSTKEYVELLYENGGKDYIYYVRSNEIITHQIQHMNGIHMNDLVSALLKFDNNRHINKISTYDMLRKTIEKHLSWNRVSELLMDYFDYIHLA